MLGGLGYALIIASTRAHKRSTFLTLDIAGMVPVAAHYLILDRPVGAALSGFYIAIDLVAAALHDDSKPWVRFAYLFTYVAALAIVAALWTDWRDIAAGFGTLLAIEARRHSSLVIIKLLVALSSAGWLTYGVLAGSLAQTIFSAVYGAMALVAARRDRLAQPLQD